MPPDDRDADPPATTVADDTIGLRAAAERLGVHYMTAYRYVRIGTLPAIKVGGEWRVRPADLTRLDTKAGDPGPGGLSWPRYRTQLEGRLLSGDEAGAWLVVERALASGAETRDLHLQLIAPVLRSIGEGWAAGAVEVAEEHRASSVASRLVGRLGPLFARRGRKLGAVVVGAVAGDHHSIPVAILGDILRGEGFDVVELGADTPTESFVRAVRDRDDVLAVALSVGADEHRATASATVADLHQAAPGIPLFLGGPAVRDGDAATELGADEFADTALGVATRCAELADARSRARRRGAGGPSADAAKARPD
jgi:excisionase family DNA binding protein